MNRKRVSYAVLLLIAGLLVTFSLELPVLGYKKLDYNKDTETTQITEYYWYGGMKKQEPFEGNPDEELAIFQKQSRLQNIQISTIMFVLMAIAGKWAREKRFVVIGSLALAVILLFADIALVIHFRGGL
ncbi:hypothetical protein GCM10007216_06050 [Thalassobacillus devorans]|uniref:DUF4306 domain-containing protein n=1 Tax=Thalassobacillus devorans TaxID=279813 RepID=A0ABQ1NRI9_9BACI|nr:hypothetical protein [Thalassobacillus devorans]NIK27518.1 hypothetical protein [Thalassobacillus devorans]GGC78309.1 hypothetical protein GCM10007216_06050 [Thalassobacillus devorans]